MPFMKGVSPVRRTWEYLNKSNLYLKPFIEIVSLNYTYNSPNHKGAKEFVFWHLAQLQYRNPTVQVITFKDLTPTPFIRAFTNTGREIILDVDRQTKEEIHERITKTLCKTKAELELERKEAEIKENPANFGYGCKRHCICEIPGQIPCPGLVPLPYSWRGKYIRGFTELDESKYL